MVTSIVLEWHWNDGLGCIHPCRIIFGAYFYKDQYNGVITTMPFMSYRRNQMKLLYGEIEINFVKILC